MFSFANTQMHVLSMLFQMSLDQSFQFLFPSEDLLQGHKQTQIVPIIALKVAKQIIWCCEASNELSILDEEAICVWTFIRSVSDALYSISSFFYTRVQKQ